MLNLKKVIASICVLAMVLSTVAFGATYTDVAEDSAYYEAVETLNKLDIVTGFEDGTFKPEDGVTRAEMAALIARIQGYGETAKNPANTGFTDVPASHWASGYVANAAGMGIINGYGDGTFGPEDPVKYEQAVKMVMATLGYTPFAEKNGGYPTGYLAAAQRYDVSLAVANAAVGTNANRGTIAQILVNALDTPLMIQSSWNTNGEVTYVIADGKTNGGVRADYKTLMSENLGYVKVRGILEDAGLVTITSEGAKTFDTTDDAAVAINVVDAYQTDNTDFATLGLKKFLVGETDAANYLGQSVIGYVKKLATDDYELVSIAVDTNRNEELVIGLDAYDSINSSNNLLYVKDGDNDTTEVDLEKTLAVVYNNQCLKDGDTDYEGAAAINSLITAPCLYGGEIRLIDNDETPGYDVAIIEAAATAVVKKVTEDGVAFKNSISLMNNNSMGMIEIDADDETKVVAIYKNGELVDASALAEWDILSVLAVAENANVIVADVISNQVVGTVTSTKASNTSAGGTAYKVADTWYDVAKNAYKAADLEIGVGGTLYIDAYGKIAAFVEDSALAGGVAANYGYIAKVEGKEADFSGDGYKVNIQIVTNNGVEVLNLKKNAKINKADGTDIKVDSTTWTSDNTASFRNDILGVVKYTVNSAGLISEITAANHDSDKFSAITTTAADAEFDAENNRLIGSGYVDEDAIVFVIGGTAYGSVNTAAITDSYVGTLADLDDEQTYGVMAKYADNKADDCNIVVINANSMKTSTTSNLAVITEVGTGTNDDGEEIYILSYYLGGELVEGVASIAKSDLSGYGSLTIGDAVKVKVGSDGIITDITSVFDFGEDIRPAYGNTVYASDNSSALAAYNNATGAKEVFAGGVVKNYKDSSTLATISTKTNGSAADAQYKLSQAENVYVVDATGLNVTVKVGSDANFKVYDVLYDSTVANVTVYADDTAITGATNISEATAAGYTDQVFVRAYEGKVKDVIIVKAEKDIKIK